VGGQQDGERLCVLGVDGVEGGDKGGTRAPVSHLSLFQLLMCTRGIHGVQSSGTGSPVSVQWWLVGKLMKVRIRNK
jgi:hypothetical protein